MKSVYIILLLACGSLFAQTNFLDHPYIETSATADTLIMPDKIHMAIVISESDSRGKKSVEELEQAMNKALTGIGISLQNDLTLVTLGSDYERYFLAGVKINKTKFYQLIVHDAITASKVISVLEQADISNVSITSKIYTKQEELLMALKVKAIKKAKKNAEAMAQAAGKTAGDILFLSDVIVPTTPNYNSQTIVLRGVASISDSLYGNRAPDPLPVDFQKLQYQVSVSAIFSID